MNKKHYILIILAIITVLLCACQKTTNVDVPKSTEIVEIIEKETISAPEELLENNEIVNIPEKDIVENQETNEVEEIPTVTDDSTKDTTDIKTEEPKQEENKEYKTEETPKETISQKEEKQKPSNPINIMSTISSVESFLNVPKESVFGSQYNKAMTLYNAILNKQDYIKIEFEGANTTIAWDNQKKFFETFEKKSLIAVFTDSGIKELSKLPKSFLYG